MDVCCSACIILPHSVRLTVYTARRSSSQDRYPNRPVSWSAETSIEPLPTPSKAQVCLSVAAHVNVLYYRRRRRRRSGGSTDVIKPFFSVSRPTSHCTGTWPHSRSVHGDTSSIQFNFCWSKLPTRPWQNFYNHIASPIYLLELSITM